MAYLSGLLAIALVTAFSLALSAVTGVDAAALPLPALGGCAVLLLLCGCAGVLPAGLAVCWLALAAAAVLLARKAGPQRLKAALPSAGLWLFAAGAAFFWLLFAVQQPMFTQWDEFTAWGLAPKMVKQTGAFYAADPVNLTAYKTYPGTSLVTCFFLALSPDFAEWQCLAALDALAMAGLAAAAAAGARRWPQAVFVFGAGALLPYFFSVLPVGTASTVYANAMADLPLALLFGGALCVYFAAGPWAMAPVLALLAMTKDIAFAYGLIAVFAVTVFELFRTAPGRRARVTAQAAGLALPVLAVFLLWNRYTAAVDPNAATAAAAGGVGGGGLSYGAVLAGGLRQLLGIGREEKFARLMALMADALFTRRVCLLGSGVMALAAIGAVTVCAVLAAERGPARRSAAAVSLALAFCFAALYLFHLILYFYNFSDVEALALKDYERYLSPYYTGWLLAMLCLLGQGARRRLSGGLLALGTVGLAVLFAWRGMPAAGFWSNADSRYSLRSDVKQRAAAANAVLDWDDRVLVVSQGDDATRWYYYKYELTAKVVNGYGGIYWGGEDTSHRWDSDFMNLVESLNWEKYEFQAVCTADSLADYMQETGCDYLLIDRADDYLEQDFSPRFAGGLQAEMPATLYRFEGADRTVCFTPVAVAESGVAQ